MKKENKRNAAVSGASGGGTSRVTPARAKALTGPTKPCFKPHQKRKPGTTRHNPTVKVVVAPPKPRPAGGGPVPLSQRPVLREFPKQPRFFKPIFELGRPLKIPAAFVDDYLKEEFPTGALLQGREGKQWRVKIEADGTIGEGWDQFAVDHDLEVGFILFFCHKGDMLFVVTVIDRDYCEREYPPIDAQDTIKIEEEEPSPQPLEVGNTASSGQTLSGCPSFTMDLGRIYVRNHWLSLPTFFASTNQLHKRLNAEVILCDPSGKEFRGLRFSWIAASNQLNITSGWKNYSTTHGLKEGASITFILVRNTKEIVEFQLHHDRSNGWKSKKYTKRLKQIELSQRYFTVPLKKSSICSGQKIPKSFADRNGLTHKGGKMIVEDGEGRSWEVSLTDNTRPTSLGRGWVKVLKANGFKEGDVLKFHLIKDGSKPVMKVTVVSKR